MKLSILIISCILLSCKSNNKAAFKPDYSPGPSAIVYKTKADYSKNVPVILSADKSEIVSYPHPTDIKSGDLFQYPTVLKGGYLLDNRGVNENVAFLKLTYEEYSKMPEAPSLEILYSLIIEKDPIIKICDCGNKKAFNNLTEQLNTLILKNKLLTVCKIMN
jgi:hypothetical protein